MKGLYACSLLFLLLSACSKKQLGKDDYLRYLRNPDNGLLKSKSIHGKTYTAFFKPAEYMALIEGGANDSTSFNERFQRYVNSYNFTFRINDGNKNFEEKVLKADLDSREDYYFRLRYLTFDMQEDLSLLVNNTDTIPCSLFHYERSFGIVPHADFSLAFERSTLDNKEMTLTLKDNFFNNGPVLFTFKKSDFEKIPALKL